MRQLFVLHNGVALDLDTGRPVPQEEEEFGPFVVAGPLSKAEARHAPSPFGFTLLGVYSVREAAEAARCARASNGKETMVTSVSLASDVIPDKVYLTVMGDIAGHRLLAWVYGLDRQAFTNRADAEENLERSIKEYVDMHNESIDDGDWGLSEEDRMTIKRTQPSQHHPLLLKTVENGIDHEGAAGWVVCREVQRNRTEVPEEWWCTKQVEHAGQMVWFSWEGHTRWPGVVVMPMSKTKLVNGEGRFYPPAASIFEATYVRNYVTGLKMECSANAGGQKTSKRKVRAVLPDGLLLTYSFGDEMYKWCRAESIWWDFKAALDESYSFPPGRWGAKKTFRDHLTCYCKSGFDGSAALKAALEWCEQEERSASARLSHAERQRLFAQAHASSPQLVSVVPATATPMKRRMLAGEVTRGDSLEQSPAKQLRANAISASDAWLRGEIVVAGEYLDQGESSHRFSHDEVLKACALLEVACSADDVSLKVAFRKKAMKVHPDKMPAHNQSWATQEMQKVNWAYRFLIAAKGGKA